MQFQEYIYICGMRYFLAAVHDLASKGFVVEIGADGWGNYKFKNGEPDYSTATPASSDSSQRICWRGFYWYFSIKTNELVYDDIGCFSLKNGGAERALQELMSTYEQLKDDVNPNGFNL